jgi:hypothetical protein
LLIIERKSTTNKLSVCYGHIYVIKIKLIFELKLGKEK